MIWVCQEQEGYHLQEFGLRQFPSWSNLSDGTWRMGGYSMNWSVLQQSQLVDWMTWHRVTETTQQRPHERCFPSLLKGFFMVCFTKRGQRQDGNDYDEGDLGLESLGQGGLVRHYKKPKATQGPWIFAGSAISSSFDSYVCILYVYNAYTNRLIDTSMLNLGWFLLGSCSSEM